MKKPLIITGRLCFPLLLLTLALIIHSCRKEAKLTQQQVNAEITASQFPVNSAMDWFNGHKAVLSNKMKVNSSADFLKNIADFTPVWDSARSAVDTNYYVVEAPAHYVNKIGFSIGDGNSNINGLTRLLILKNKKDNSLHAVLMQIHGDTGVDITNVHYMAIPKTFSGNIFYTTLQGLFYNGYIYKDGNVALVSAGKNNTTKPSGPQILQVYVPGYCVETTTNWFSWKCWIENNGDIERCEYTYDYTEIDTYCVPGFYTPEGGGGVILPQCPPNNVGNPPVGVESVNGKKYINVAEPGNGDDGGDGTNPCVPIAADAFKILDSIDAKYKCAKTLLAMLPDFKNDLSQLINTTFNSTGSKDITFKDAPASQLKDPTEDGECTDYHILINQDILNNGSGEYILATFFHEALHAFLNSEFSTLGNTAFAAKYPDVHIITQPYIANSGLLKYKFMFSEGDHLTQVSSDSQHRTMASYFVDKIAAAILSYNPNFPPDRANALARYGIFADDGIKTANDAERDKTKGNSVGINCSN